ncbi:MAG: (2Fe-2S)-binding protein [Anaerolineae bacterium]|jgi:aerobic-type carbon monoxide dehydrogenase small subunit (CoxS/CutS family)|nr:(2Fe-2S)-binding protein [Anaerolineae bacterium]
MPFRGPAAVPLVLHVNGEDFHVFVEPRRTLLSVLREELGLTGAKLGCGHGQCGACTVILDGETAYACLTLAIDCEDREIRTIEGLMRGDSLHPVQEALIAHDGYQCGFCTPGQVMSAVSLLEHNPRPTDDEIREGMAGNVCRCGAYPNIIASVAAAAELMAAEGD